MSSESANGSLRWQEQRSLAWIRVLSFKVFPQWIEFSHTIWMKREGGIIAVARADSSLGPSSARVIWFCD